MTLDSALLRIKLAACTGCNTHLESHRVAEEPLMALFPVHDRRRHPHKQLSHLRGMMDTLDAALLSGCCRHMVAQELSILNMSLLVDLVFRLHPAWDRSMA